MKLLFVFLSFTTVILLSACTSKIQKWEKDLESCISATDSIHYLLKTEIGHEALLNELLEAEITWNQIKLKFSTQPDTLSKDQMEILDEFNVAFHNARKLKTEHLKCSIASTKQRLRLQQLKSDISLGSGKRSEYCQNVQHEKEELTIIRKHANDIHRRFEELKRTKKQFNENFAL